ncbi:Tn3 family transposase [Mesorhizobium helmanticense]|uniref:Tn3 family transposase n=1 Tax=Mesorhizobium helmanticense TaxID=1776423 RepID=UPI003CC985DA
MRARCQCNTLAIRNTAIWGEAGTACASESKKFGAWDGNLMTEWHVRYGGRGVMTLACRKGLDLHFRATGALFVVGGRRDDQGRAATLHQRGDSGPIFDSQGQSAVGVAFRRLLGFTCRHV